MLGDDNDGYHGVSDRAQTDANHRLGKSKPKNQAHFENDENPLNFVESTKNQAQNTAKSEASFFESIKYQLPPQSYETLMKLTHIYMNCLISYKEFCLMSEDIIGSIDRKLWQLFKEIFESREASRKKGSILFAGIKEKSDSNFMLDLDSMFSSTENESYHRILSVVPIIKNTTDDQIAIDNINIRYFSALPPSDKPSKENQAKNYEYGVQKKSSMKNTYEETLFKIEDERFEIDIHIHRFRATINWLKKLEKLDLKDSKIAELHLRLVDKVRKMQIIELIYGNKAEEVLKGLEKENQLPVIIGQVIKRLQEKLDVIIETKSKYEKENWVQNRDACFHRSLDEKSISIKHYDRKTFLNKSKPFQTHTDFITELESRNSAIMKKLTLLKNRTLPIKNQSDLDDYRSKALTVGQKRPSDEIQDLLKISDMLMPYNSFFGISNDLKCETNKNLVFATEEIM